MCMSYINICNSGRIHLFCYCSYLFSFYVHSGSTPFAIQSLSRLFKQLREWNEVIEQEKPFTLSVKTQSHGSAVGLTLHY